MTIQTDTPPITQWTDGSLRIGSTRLLLELVLREFQSGATAEQIVLDYDVLTLADVYAVIAYFLRHREEIDAYLKERNQLGEMVKQKIEASQRDIAEIRARLMARQSSRG